jgi:hypothetical protein
MNVGRWCGCAVLVLIGLADAQAGAIGVHKCTDASGRVSYQQQACAATQRADVVVVEGEIDPSRKAAADAIARANRPSPAPLSDAEWQELARQRGLPWPDASPAPAPTPVAPKKVRCPDTYDKYFSEPNTAPIIGYETVWLGTREEKRPIYGTPQNQKFRGLPSKTYLKNAGRWPEGCEE